MVSLGIECFYKQLCMLKPRSTDEKTATKVNLFSSAYTITVNQNLKK